MTTGKHQTAHNLARSIGWTLVCWSALVGTSLADTATVYRCTKSDGTVILSGTPCGPDAKRLTVEAPSAGTGGEASLKSQAELARQYDADQRARMEAAAKAQAAAPPRRTALPRRQNRPRQAGIYYGGSSIYGYESYTRQPSWSIHGSGTGWRFDVDSGVHHRPLPSYRPPSRSVPSTFFDPMPAYLAPEP